MGERKSGKRIGAVELMKEWKHRCELKLLMCQPNPLRPDRVTIGYVLRDMNPESPQVEVRFAKDLSAVRCIYPNADIEAIEGTLFEMESVLKNVTDFENYMQSMPADFPADFELLPGGAVLTDSIEKELVLLEQQFLSKLRKPGAEGTVDVNPPDPSGRPYLRRRMDEAFRPRGLRTCLQRISRSGNIRLQATR